MKKVVLGTVIAAAALFTGCEDVKEVTSCDLKGNVFGYDVHACVESEDDAYIKQLNSYKDYISTKTNKKIDIYLFSIISGTLNKI